jgi:hypothetical protein
MHAALRCLRRAVRISKKFSKWLLGSGTSPGKPQAVKVEILTFQEVVRYFTEDKPDDPRITGGALLRNEEGGGSSRYHQFFIDEKDLPVANDGAIYGRVLRAAEVDDELASAFGRSENDLVIFR